MPIMGLDQKFIGAATLAPSAPKPTTVYESRTRAPCPSTFALSVTSDPDRLTTLQENPGRKLPGVFLCA